MRLIKVSLVALVALIFIGLYVSQATKVHSASSIQSNPWYVVSELEVESSAEGRGAVYRIAKIEGLAYEPETTVFQGLKTVPTKPKGINTLGEDGMRWSTPGKLLSPSSGWTEKQDRYLEVTSVFNDSFVRLEGAGLDVVRYRIRVLKACPAVITESETVKLYSSQGFISLPKLRTSPIMFVEKPTCYDETDQLFQVVPPKPNSDW